MAKFADEPPAAQPEKAAPCESGCQACAAQPAPTPNPPAAQQQTQPTRPETKKVGDSKECPLCKTSCDSLEVRRCVVEEGKAETDGISHMLDFTIDDDDRTTFVVFKCPNCGAVLFDEEDDAVDFLENEPKQ